MFLFSIESDIALLGQIEMDPPFGKKYGLKDEAWKAIARCIMDSNGNSPSGRRAQERFDSLVECHVEGTLDTMRNSSKASEDNKKERQRLLVVVIGIKTTLEQANQQSKADKETEEQGKQQAKETRQAVADDMLFSPSSSRSTRATPSPKVSRKRTMADMDPLIVEEMMKSSVERNKTRNEELEIRRMEASNMSKQLEIQQQQIELQKKASETNTQLIMALLATIKKAD